MVCNVGGGKKRNPCNNQRIRNDMMPRIIGSATMVEIISEFSTDLVTISGNTFRTLSGLQTKLRIISSLFKPLSNARRLISSVFPVRNDIAQSFYVSVWPCSIVENTVQLIPSTQHHGARIPTDWFRYNKGLLGPLA